MHFAVTENQNTELLASPSQNPEGSHLSSDLLGNYSIAQHDYWDSYLCLLKKNIKLDYLSKISVDNIPNFIYCKFQYSSSTIS